MKRTVKALAAGCVLASGIFAGNTSGSAWGAAASGNGAAPPFAQKAEDGKSLVVPQELRARGTAYHTISTDKPQVYFESNAPLEKIKGNSAAVVGYVILGGPSPASIRGGEWHLPVTSMKTGIALRDEHIANDSWLDAAKNPDIVFQLKEVADATLTKQSPDFATYEATLVGDMTIHGVTNPVRIPAARITLLSESERTRKIAPGELMAIRSKFSVSLPDYGVSNVAIENEKVSNTIELDVSLFLSTQRPKA